jgi:dehydrogenase/reductase SDR family protein 12
MPVHTARGALARMTDAVAEATVAPSFSRVGIALRRRLEEWGDPPPMKGSTVLVTGATSGIGLATATALASLGAEVHLVGRDPERGAKALAAVETAGPGQHQLHLVDLSDPDAVRSLGERLGDTMQHLDALVHNAGALTRAYQTTASGVERTLATHVLGPYVLTASLAPLLFSSPQTEDVNAARGTIVTMSSGGMYAQPFDLAALESGPDGYDGVVAYARAKRAQLLLAAGWAGRFAPAGVASYAMHPGWVDTPGLAEGLPRFQSFVRPLLRTPADGADTAVWLAAGGPVAEARAGGRAALMSGFFHDRRLRSDHRFPVRHPSRPGDPARLLSWCAARTGIDTPVPAVPGTRPGTRPGARPGARTGTGQGAGPGARR